MSDKSWDHKVLGKSLDLFTFSNTVGQGLPLWTPKGAVIRRELERFIVDEEIKRGYLHVYTPDIAKLALYEKSGHYPYYKDSMYAPIDIDGDKFMLRPMTCPHHFELYLSRPRSYKELPMRIAELAKLYRYEQSGELMGLQRVRSFCLSDAHIIVTKEQTETEIDTVLDLIDYVAKVLGLEYHEGDEKKGDYYYRLSLGDRSNAKKYYKDDEAWEHAENILRKALQKRKIAFKEAADEAAFYGPKIDIQMWNANGKEDTAFTVQYDFVMPKRFNLRYINEQGEEIEPVVIHRSAIGAIERIIALLIEKYKGAFPMWLSPVQVKILPITDRAQNYAKEVANELLASNIRAEVDDRSETLQAKIRDAQLEKIPFMFVLGDREAENKTISVRSRDGAQHNGLGLESVKQKLIESMNLRTLELPSKL
ncbi:threonine--tRNA ligase [Candidatus Woesebacteria bacterium RIFCSPHIGHO2_01_FULL_41_10]|uniref:Threonine--tRNA ligase n=1 Tax=Candidatus Woesebacteria bacterium RIFCSPHIGHO2_01_FULL_41_10 TaxID=1802500 RepID=A0A1F7YNS6_9BACT|nr:MAG: threonine--tRNA ligase [Candidatus Woesebacteria bacterium RIFCSPHIGHO2_01_FULL_41_10]